jgi:hypothetical protein
MSLWERLTMVYSAAQVVDSGVNKEVAACRSAFGSLQQTPKEEMTMDSPHTMKEDGKEEQKRNENA